MDCVLCSEGLVVNNFRSFSTKRSHVGDSSHFARFFFNFCFNCRLMLYRSIIFSYEQRHCSTTYSRCADNTEIS